MGELSSCLFSILSFSLFSLQFFESSERSVVLIEKSFDSIDQLLNYPFHHSHNLFIGTMYPTIMSTFHTPHDVISLPSDLSLLSISLHLFLRRSLSRHTHSIQRYHVSEEGTINRYSPSLSFPTSIRPHWTSSASSPVVWSSQRVASLRFSKICKKILKMR